MMLHTVEVSFHYTPSATVAVIDFTYYALFLLYIFILMQLSGKKIVILAFPRSLLLTFPRALLLDTIQ